MENFSSTCGTRSRPAASGDKTRSPVRCEVGPSSEDVVGESLGCNVIADTTIVTKFLANKLLLEFEQPAARDPLPQEEVVRQKILKVIQRLIKNEMCNDLDIVKQSSIKEN